MEYFNERLNKLFSLDVIRICKFAEMIQYSFIFLALVTFFTHLLNEYYYRYIGKEKKMNKKNMDYFTLFKDFMLIFSDILIVLFSFFYIRKIGLLFPSIPSLLYPKFKPHTTLEYTIHIALVVFFIELLPKLKHRIEVWNHNTETI